MYTTYHTVYPIPYRVSKTAGHSGQFGQFAKTLSKIAKNTAQTFKKVWPLLDPSGQFHRACNLALLNWAAFDPWWVMGGLCWKQLNVSPLD